LVGASAASLAGFRSLATSHGAELSRLSGIAPGTGARRLAAANEKPDAVAGKVQFFDA
jgi:hypothetical protein